MILTRNFKSGWSPRSLPVTLWLDGNDPAGNGILPANSTAISTFVDKSGNGRDFMQITGANQPLYGAAAQNGKGILVCNGTTNFMNCPIDISDIITDMAFTIYAAFSSSFTNSVGPTISQQAAIICDAGGYFALQVFKDGASNKFGAIYGNDNISDPIPEKQQIVDVILNTPTILKISRDDPAIFGDTDLSIVNGDGDRWTIPCGPIADLTNQIFLFQDWTADRWFSGNFYELFCMNTISTVQQDKFAKKYLRAKWGIS